jgi:hypothetical protein
LQSMPLTPYFKIPMTEIACHWHKRPFTKCAGIVWTTFVDCVLTRQIWQLCRTFHTQTHQTHTHTHTRTRTRTQYTHTHTHTHSHPQTHTHTQHISPHRHTHTHTHHKSHLRGLPLVQDAGQHCEPHCRGHSPDAAAPHARQDSNIIGHHSNTMPCAPLHAGRVKPCRTTVLHCLDSGT